MPTAWSLTESSIDYPESSVFITISGVMPRLPYLKALLSKLYRMLLKFFRGKGK